MENRKKAQDVFNDTNFIFLQITSFEKAFPEIENISVTVTETGEGTYRGSGISHYGKTSVGEFINCKNPKCYNGGFNIGDVIRDLVFKKEPESEGTSYCQGYEGSPNGRKRYGDCENYFAYKVKIEYKKEETESESI